MREGDIGTPTKTVQYYLSIIAYFNQNLSPVPLSGIFDSETIAAVERFQKFYALAETGEVDAGTWNTITKIYSETVAALPEGYQGNNAKLYPGYFLSEGMRNQNVTDLQTYLNLISKSIPEIPSVSVTGYFGEQTENAVSTFQRLYGIEVSGAVGPVTWYQIAREYNSLVGNS